MVKLIVATLVIFGVLLGWVWVQGAYARFAARHPRLGPYRDSDGACGGGCCSGKEHCEPGGSESGGSPELPRVTAGTRDPHRAQAVSQRLGAAA